MTILTAKVATVKLGLIEIENLVIPFCGSPEFLLHSEIVRDSRGRVDFNLSKATLQLKNKEDINHLWVKGYQNECMGILDDDNFFSWCEIKDEVDLNKDEHLWTSADWDIRRVELSLIDWTKYFHFKDKEKDNQLTSLGLAAFLGPKTSVLSLLFTFGFLFPGLNLNPTICREKPEKKQRKEDPKGLVYLIGCEQTKTLKIGFTQNLNQRLQTLQQASPFELRVIGIKKGTLETEKIFLNLFKQFRLKGEWFMWDDSIVAFFTK